MPEGHPAPGEHSKINSIVMARRGPGGDQIVTARWGTDHVFEARIITNRELISLSSIHGPKRSVDAEATQQEGALPQTAYFMFSYAAVFSASKNRLFR
jgi:hypothetical protein